MLAPNKDLFYNRKLESAEVILARVQHMRAQKQQTAKTSEADILPLKKERKNSPRAIPKLNNSVSHHCKKSVPKKTVINKKKISSEKNNPKMTASTRRSSLKSSKSENVAVPTDSVDVAASTLSEKTAALHAQARENTKTMRQSSGQRKIKDSKATTVGTDSDDQASVRRSSRSCSQRAAEAIRGDMLMYDDDDSEDSDSSFPSSHSSSNCNSPESSAPRSSSPPVSPPRLSEYEKQVQEKVAERLRFLESLRIGDAKKSLAELL